LPFRRRTALEYIAVSLSAVFVGGETEFAGPTCEGQAHDTRGLASSCHSRRLVGLWPISFSAPYVSFFDCLLC
jgi:hypothetical protein